MKDLRTDGPWLLSRERLAPAERTLLGAFGLVPLWAVWDLVIRPWPAVLSLAALLIVPIVIGALTVGGVFLAAAVLAPEREIWVDPEARRILDHGTARWFGPWRRSYPFDAVESVGVEQDPDAEGADRWCLLLRLRGRRAPVVLASRLAPERAELDGLAARLRAALQP